MENLTNSQKKHNIWEKIKDKYSHLTNFCKIELIGIDDESIYFHPKFILDENTYITSQSDCESNNYVYAFMFITTTNGITTNIEIDEDLVSPIVVGYNSNKEIVKLTLQTLSKIKDHIRKIEIYANDYVSNILIGNSIKDLTRAFINELGNTEKLIEFMQKIK